MSWLQLIGWRPGMSRVDHFQDITIAGNISIGANASFTNPGGVSIDTIFGGKINDIRVVTSASFPTIQSAVDDITDTTSATTSAVGSGGSIVMVPPGVYPETVTGKTNVRIIGYGSSTVIQATGNDVTIYQTTAGKSGTDATFRTGLENIALDGNSKTGVTAMDIVNTRFSSFSNIRIVGGAASGTAMKLRTKDNSIVSSSNDDTAENQFYSITTTSWNVGLEMAGDRSGTVGGVVANNSFFGMRFGDCVSRGIDFQDFVDTNTFYHTMLTIRNQGTAIEWNSVNPTLDKDNARNSFFDLALGASGSPTPTTGTTALKFNRTDGNRVYGFFNPLASDTTNINITDSNAFDNIIDDTNLLGATGDEKASGWKLAGNRLQLLPIDPTAASGNSSNIELYGRASSATVRSQINASGNSIQLIPNTAGAVSIFLGLTKDASGFKHTRIASGTTGGSLHDTASATWTFTTAFADTGYTLTATIDNPTGVPIIAYTDNKAAGSIDIIIIAGSAAAASGTLNLIAVHD